MKKYSKILPIILILTTGFLLLEAINIYDIIPNVTVPKTYIKDSPESLAQLQLDGYNTRDIEKFLSAYSDDVEIYLFPNELLYTGKETMRKNYTEYFAKAGEELYCNLDDRLVYQNFVFDKETITTAIPGRESFTGQAIYETKDGEIIRIWFIK